VVTRLTARRCMTDGGALSEGRGWVWDPLARDRRGQWARWEMRPSLGAGWRGGLQLKGEKKRIGQAVDK
jgi:hypothetical protein